MKPVYKRLFFFLMFISLIQIHVSTGRCYSAHTDRAQRGDGSSCRNHDAQPCGVHASQLFRLDGRLFLRHTARNVHVRKGAITSKIKPAIKHETSPARLA